MGMALGPKSDDTVFFGSQVTEARGGGVRLSGDRVILSGQAVMRGELVA